MHRINTIDSVAGKFSDGDRGAGREGTIADAAFFNSLQEEICSIIEASGATLDALNDNQLLPALMNLVYPKGCVYTTYDDEKTPFQLFGVGTWVLCAVGRVHVGQNDTDADFANIGQQGGEKKHALGITEIPEHQHLNGVADDLGGMFVYDKTTAGMPGTATQSIRDEATATTYQGKTSLVGGGVAHNNLQPYEVVRKWRRTE